MILLVLTRLIRLVFARFVLHISLPLLLSFPPSLRVVLEKRLALCLTTVPASRAFACGRTLPPASCACLKLLRRFVCALLLPRTPHVFLCVCA